MRLLQAIITILLFIGVGVAIGLFLPGYFLLLYLFILVLLEIGSYFIIRSFSKDFPWLITPKDETPELSIEGLKKFFSFGFDPELGWVRKPNTSKEEFGSYNSATLKYDKVIFHIDEKGARFNPEHEHLSATISCYGDSFTIARQVEDNQTWAWHLSKLTKSNVLNFGIGNYGLDQALLRLKREYPKNKTKVVIMGVVPSTIVRCLDMWKHYNEYGNTFGFKPRFDFKEGELQLIPNIIDSEEKYHHYQAYLAPIQQSDYFYKRKFKKDMIQFPYFLSILSNSSRNIALLWSVFWYQKVKKEDIKSMPYPTAMKVIMNENLKLRYNLYTKDVYANTLIIRLAEEFKRYADEQGFTPLFLLMPQKDDILIIKKKGNYYGPTINQIRQVIPVIDLTQTLLVQNDLDSLYSDPNDYGGHYSAAGNKIVAQETYKELRRQKIL